MFFKKNQHWVSVDFSRPTSLNEFWAVTPMTILHQRAVDKVRCNSWQFRMNLLLKRVLDIVCASAALLLLSPLLLLTAVLIRLESSGGALFIQERWGKGMKKIRVYKFRSMFLDKCDVSGVQQTVHGDARVTKVGSFIRRFNIDELPQLLNVIAGDLSLVGPRCHAIGMKAAGVLYEDLVPQYHTRHLVKPGITGLSQSRGLRGPTIDAGLAIMRIENDLRYIEDLSVWSDVKIILHTAKNEIWRGSGS